MIPIHPLSRRAALATSLVLIIAVSNRAGAEDPAPGRQVEQRFTTEAGLEIPYLLHLPERDPASTERPAVLLFLHGRGESNGPLAIVAKWGPPRFAARGDRLPWIVVSPQCPTDSRWAADDQQAGLLALLDHVIERFDADPNRTCLTGLSMGGFGSWRLAADHPERFAAVAPICGGGTPEDAPKLAKLPIWVFHGTDDQAVAFDQSTRMVEAIQAAGSTSIRFTSLEHVGHNSWSAAYATPELWDWFAKHRISDRKP